MENTKMKNLELVYFKQLVAGGLVVSPDLLRQLIWQEKYDIVDYILANKLYTVNNQTYGDYYCLKDVLDYFINHRSDDDFKTFIIEYGKNINNILKERSEEDYKNFITKYSKIYNCVSYNSEVESIMYHACNWSKINKVKILLSLGYQFDERCLRNVIWFHDEVMWAIKTTPVDSKAEILKLILENDVWDFKNILKTSKRNVMLNMLFKGNKEGYRVLRKYWKESIRRNKNK